MLLIVIHVLSVAMKHSMTNVVLPNVIMLIAVAPGAEVQVLAKLLLCKKVLWNLAGGWTKVDNIMKRFPILEKT